MKLKTVLLLNIFVEYFFYLDNNLNIYSSKKPEKIVNNFSIVY